MTDHLEPFNGFGSENPSFKQFLNNLFENSHIMGGIFGILMKIFGDPNLCLVLFHANLYKNSTVQVSNSLMRQFQINNRFYFFSSDGWVVAKEGEEIHSTLIARRGAQKLIIFSRRRNLWAQGRAARSNNFNREESGTVQSAKKPRIIWTSFYVKLPKSHQRKFKR